MADADLDRERRLAIGAERRARTRTKILAAAFELFGHEQGLCARIEDFAKAAGVTRPTFYNHFSNMEELREDVAPDYAEQMARHIVLGLGADPARANAAAEHPLPKLDSV